MIQYFEDELNDKIVNKINEIITLQKQKEIDFLNFEDKLGFIHPYKYEKNKDRFMEYFKNSKITVNSKGKIQTTYDIVESNKRQEGESK